MDPILTRLERLEREYRRSRLSNRIALLALLVVVSAGFAQQQDPRLPDVIKCERIEANSVQAQRVGADVLRFKTSLSGGDSSEGYGATFNVSIARTVSLRMHASSADGDARQDRSPGLSLATFDISVNERSAGCSAFQTYAPPTGLAGLPDKKQVTNRMFMAFCDKETGSAMKLLVNGKARAVLGVIDGVDKLGRETRHPESTLTLLDKDGNFLERLPR